MTSGGIGYTFNAEDFWTIYKRNSYTKAFADAMKPHGFNIHEKSSPLKPKQVNDFSIMQPRHFVKICVKS